MSFPKLPRHSVTPHAASSRASPLIKQFKLTAVLWLDSSIISFLFPIFASYKALKTSDPAQLTPWLMYWVVFSISLLVESWFYFILAWYATSTRYLVEHDRVN